MEPVVILSKLEQEHLLRAIEAAVQVRDARQLFLWAQGQLQLLLPHRLMLCLQFDANDTLLRLECLHGAVLDDAAIKRLCDPSGGLALRIARHCRDGQRMPCMSGAGRRGADVSLAGFQDELSQAGFENMLVHGSGRLEGGSTMFVLCGFPLRPGVRHAYFLELLLPHLHLALMRLSAQPNRGAQPALHPLMARPLSVREADILRWVQQGKSNYEVGCILGISALTVKNHLQRIYKTLGVSNRTHALSRCMSLRLLEPAPPAQPGALTGLAAARRGTRP